MAVNFEEGEYGDIKTARQLYSHVKDRLSSRRKTYVFLDEVQRVTDFQEAVDNLYIRKDCDVYITGSNASLLSGELATLLSGRYVEIRMLPPSFKEYVSAFPQDLNIDRLYANYTQNSAFPYALEIEGAKNRRL